MAVIIKRFDNLSANQLKEGGVSLKDHADESGVTSRWIPFSVDTSGRIPKVYAYRVVQEFDHD